MRRTRKYRRGGFGLGLSAAHQSTLQKYGKAAHGRLGAHGQGLVNRMARGARAAHSAAVTGSAGKIGFRAQALGAARGARASLRGKAPTGTAPSPFKGGGKRRSKCAKKQKHRRRKRTRRR